MGIGTFFGIVTLMFCVFARWPVTLGHWPHTLRIPFSFVFCFRWVVGDTGSLAPYLANSIFILDALRSDSGFPDNKMIYHACAFMFAVCVH